MRLVRGHVLVAMRQNMTFHKHKLAKLWIHNRIFSTDNYHSSVMNSSNRKTSNGLRLTLSYYSKSYVEVNEVLDFVSNTTDTSIKRSNRFNGYIAMTPLNEKNILMNTSGRYSAVSKNVLWNSIEYTVRQRSRWGKKEVEYLDIVTSKCLDSDTSTDIYVTFFHFAKTESIEFHLSCCDYWATFEFQP